MTEIDSEITINEAEKCDVEEIFETASQANLSYWSADDYRAEIKRTDSIVLVARQRAKIEKVIGFLAARLIITNYLSLTNEVNSMKDNFAEIYNIGVVERKRKRKIGEKLILDFFSRCIKHNVREIWLEVRVSNTAAISFYKKMGFMTIHERKGFYTDPREDALVMKCALP